MTELISVLFKVGRPPNQERPRPDNIEHALRSFLVEGLGAADIGKKIGVPSNLSVRYEMRFVEEKTPDGKIPFHLSIRGPKEAVVPWFAQLKNTIDDVLLRKQRPAGLEKMLKEIGIPSSHPVEFKLYARSPEGEPLGPYPIGPR